MRPAMRSFDVEKKIILIGDPAVGKTSLIRRFVTDKFDDRYLMTIGMKATRKALELTFDPPGVRVLLNLSVWDILGQRGVERAHTIYFRGAEAFILVFDGTRRDTFESISYWVERVRELCGPVPGMLVCNKVDLRSEFVVSAEELKGKAKQLGVGSIATSAKSGENVERIFQQVGEVLCRPLAEGRA